MSNNYNDNQENYAKMEKLATNTGKALSTSGKAVEVVGDTTKIVGGTAKIVGSVAEKTGEAVSSVGSGVTKVGAKLSSTGIGAVVGVPLSAVGGVANIAGKTVKGIGSGVKKTGSAVQNVGRNIKNTGRQLKNNGRSINYKAHEMSMLKRNFDFFFEGKGKAPLTLKLLFRKNKFAFIGIGAGIFLCIVFMMVIMVPVMSVLGLFGDENSSEIITGTNNALSGGYTEVSKNISYWFPVGSSETTTIGGVTYASGEPMSTNITSSFGNQEAFRTSKHGGIDIGNGGNGPGVVNIIAAKDGVVTYPSDTSQTAYDDNGYYGNYADGGGFGNYVMIKHNDGTVTVYAHLAQNSITVFSGDTVRQGQVIGKMGHSGSSTGTHLHFEVRVNGTRVYPLNYISASNTRP